MPQKFACIYLDYGLNLSHDKIYPCCPDSRYKRPEIPFHGGEIPLETFFDLRKTTREEIRRGTSPCLQCPQLVSSSGPHVEGIIKYITFNHFRECNSRCYYCDFWHVTKKDIYQRRYSALPLLRQLIAENRITEDASISWGGGEPTILEEFDELMILITERNLDNFVNTNGLRFSPVLATAIKGRTRMQLSLDSGTEETYARVKGREKFRRVVENLHRYAEANAKNISLKYIVARENNAVADILGFLSIVKKLGIPRIVISPEAGEVREKSISEQSLDSAALLWREAAAHGISVTAIDTLYGKALMERILPKPGRRSAMVQWASTVFRRLR
jgi:poly(ribitol-phosphate) beta-N-acetylglucosaminyltransferase